MRFIYYLNVIIFKVFKPMKNSFRNYLIYLFILASIPLFSQTFTMGKKCKASLETAQQALANESYEDALQLYEAFNSKCKTKDAKEIGAYQKADVLNHLGRYDEALIEADKALKVTKDKSLNGYFQKAIALKNLGKLTEAKAAFEHIITLTEKNENSKERASNYALMAAYYERSEGDIKMAQDYLNKAKELDNTNIKFLIQEGDMYVAQGNYNTAFESYDHAIKIDSNSKLAYMARSEARFSQVSKKYNTTKAQELRTKMTSSEKENLCSDLSKAIELGYKDMQKEMLKALICK